MSSVVVPTRLRTVHRRLCANDPSLVRLDLGGINCGSRGALALAEGLSNNSALQELNLSYNLILPDGASALALGLSCCCLEVLDLRFNSLGSSGAESLGQALVHTQTLKVLLLRNSSVGPQGAVILALGLVHNTSLVRLDLGNNLVRTQGALALCNALESNKTLKWLGLWDNDIDTQGIVAIARALGKNTSLTMLNLRENAIENEGAAALGQLLHTNTSLKELNLGDFRIGTAGAIALADGLRHNNTLTSLDMAPNKMGVVGARAFLHALKHNNRTLTTLSLGIVDCAMLEEIEYYLKLNKSGRAHMGDVTIPLSLWPFVLARVSHDVNLLHAWVSARPDFLC